jgi:hypothetical protein
VSEPAADTQLDGHSHADGHSHTDGHGHEHGHRQESTETLPEPTGPGTVLVDIGGAIGAAVVTTPVALADEEIEIRPEPGEWTGRHVAVRPRPLPDRTIHAAFFESLTEGPYVVRVRFGPEGAVEVPVVVTGGRVTQVAWPD